MEVIKYQLNLLVFNISSTKKDSKIKYKFRNPK